MNPKLEIFKILENFSRHPCLALSIVLFSIPFLLATLTTTHKFSTAIAVVSTSPECPYGRLYVYDLPSFLNDDVLRYNCTNPNFHPRYSICSVDTTNNGLGGPAANIRRILPENLSTSWYRTSKWTLELIFHRRILQHKCRTLEPESAAAFYIPYYAGLAVRKDLLNKNITKREMHDAVLLRWIQRQHYWKRSNGSDHFTAIGRIAFDFHRKKGGRWGTSLLQSPVMKRVMSFVLERFGKAYREVSVPYPTGFHPGTLETVVNWQSFVREYNRSRLFAFAGGTRSGVPNDFRGLLLSYCSGESSSCRALNYRAAGCSDDSSETLELFLGSEFCLQPRGDSYTRRSVFECMIAGSVPVVFWNSTIYNEQYKWFLPAEPEEYSVFIDRREVRRNSSVIKEVLMRYSKEEIRRKREKVIEIIPRIIYGVDNGGSKDFEDAFDIALSRFLGSV